MSGEQKVGRVQRAKLRDVWGHEARDFTTWLEENVDLLNEATGLRLSGAEREKSTGSFSVDLIAEDEKGRAVVIENQLVKSDHDHLGKLLTYLVGLEAKQAIWIVADPRPEHIGVITWLNESASADFYLLKLEAIRIDDSDPAPWFTLIVGPSEDTREVGRTKKEMTDRGRLRYRFFERLLEQAKSMTSLHASISPGTASWVGAGAGITGLSFNYVVRRHDARVELYIDTRDGDENRRIFEALHEAREEIERRFEAPLEWDTKEGRRACRIEKTFGIGGWRDEGNWEAVHEQLVEGMITLESAIRPDLTKLRQGS